MIDLNSAAVLDACLARLGSRFEIRNLANAPGRAELTSIDLAACMAPVEITREQFNNACDFGYFMAWTTMGDSESFHCPEPYEGSVHTAWVRLGDRCFTLRRPLHETHLELVARVLQHLRVEAAATLFN